ncbi:leucine-rich repeat flightless-interacting protein 2 isoform X13 [Serinus canaria]|uniref:leucine-rich repeat flightless-interacting protein 2 isoform X13 n=1 Tax=Serinus canaria TaxID=9135 RepID=UPI0021CC819E|nr:leucine-rich repeat flightless-interacting protein 2 isoform X13 [Serinus canaria]
MGTPGSGRKRTPVKDRFSAEDEALSNIAREPSPVWDSGSCMILLIKFHHSFLEKTAEARLAAKRAARAEARDIRMRELERQQKEFSQHLYDRKWAHIQKWMEDAERARYSHQPSRHSHLSGIYYDQRNYSSLGYSKPVPSYHVWSSSLYSDPVAPARIYRPSECSYSSRTSSVRSSPVLEEKSEKSHSEIFSRPSSRNSDSLAEVEEKYRKAMVSNAQLDNEKNNLIYQVDTLKDVIEEKEEQIAEFYRENEEKSKELERQKHTCSVLQHKLDELKEGLRQRDELIEANQRMQANIDSITKEVFDLQETINWKDKKIGALERQKDYFDCIKNERDELREELADLKETRKRGQKHGLVIIPDGTPNGDLNHESVVGTITVVSQEAAQVLESAGEGPLDIRLRKLAGEKEELLSQVRKLKMQLEEERQKYSKSDSMSPDAIDLENGSDLQLIEMQRDANRQISEYKFKLSKAEQDITTLEQNIGRLEGQVARYKSAAENAEKVEDELKAEKRKLQRELRTALDKIEEMEMTNSHLMKRLEKMKANRTALLSQQ